MTPLCGSVSLKMKTGAWGRVTFVACVYLKFRELILKEPKPVGISLGTVLRRPWLGGIFPVLLYRSKGGGMYKVRCFYDIPV